MAPSGAVDLIESDGRIAEMMDVVRRTIRIAAHGGSLAQSDYVLLSSSRPQMEDDRPWLTALLRGWLALWCQHSCGVDQMNGAAYRGREEGRPAPDLRIDGSLQLQPTGRAATLDISRWDSNMEM